MKICTLLFLITIINFAKSSAQWNVINVGANSDLYSVDYYSLNDIWIGSDTSIIKTNDSGVNWNMVHPIRDNLGVDLMQASVYDLALTNTNTAIATGFYLLGSTEIILKTTNGALNWNYASQNNTVGQYIRYINSVELYPNSTRAVAVGENGRIGRSSNAGNTWTLTNLGTSLLFDVKFSSYDTVFAVGESRILKSVNGGITWSTTNRTGTFKSVSCNHNVIYVGNYSSTNNQFLLKSVDYGATYTTINLPFTYAGVLHVINKDTVLVAGSDGIYVSTSEGQYWEKYIIPSYKKIKMFDFYDHNKGIAVGESGYVVKTDYLPTAPKRPLSLFSIISPKINYCIGDSISFANSSLPGCSYQWQLNGVTFSSSYTSGVRLNNEGIQSISLIVSNAFGSDTLTQQVTVLGHVIIPTLFTASADSVCAGTIIELYIANSKAGISYQLRKGFTKVGAAQNGTGGTLTFSSIPSINSTTLFNIKSLRSNSCYTDSLIQYKSIYAFSSSEEPMEICTPANTYSSNINNLGITNVTFNGINNSTNNFVNNYFDYSCCKKTDVVMGNNYPISISTFGANGEYVKVWIDYDNNGLFSITELVLSGFANHTLIRNVTIPTTTIFNQKVRMRVVSAIDSNLINNPCTNSSGVRIEDYGITVLPAPTSPISSYTYTLTSACSVTAAFTNTSYNAISYSWNFGDGASSTLINPSHIYTVSGTYDVSLITWNPYGCDTIFQSVIIAIPQVPKLSCTPVILPESIQSLLTFDFDSLLNYYNQFGFSNGYHDLTCTEQFRVHLGSRYDMRLAIGNTTWANLSFRIWIDYNNDGVLDWSETISNNPNGGGQNYLTFPVLIPTNSVQNTPLRLRVMLYKSGNGYIYDGCNGNDRLDGASIYDFTLFVDPPIPVVANFNCNVTNTCTNQQVEFTNTSNAPVNLWDFGDSTVSTAYSPAHTYMTPGVYTVKLISSNSISSDTIIKTNYITVNEAPPVSNIICSGGQLSTTVIGSTYQWYLNGGARDSATLSIFTPLEDGNYSVKVTNSSGCSRLYNYAYFPIHIVFDITPKSVCTSTQNTFINSSANATSYTIYWGDGTSYTYSGIGNVTHAYSMAGRYTVKLVGCKNGKCDSLIKVDYMKVYNILPVPIIRLVGNQLSTDTIATTYKWYFNGTLIPGANSANYSPTLDGNYTVTISNGCNSRTSTAYSYYPLHINFTASTTSCASTAINFNNSTLNATSYLWDFGDGTTSTLNNPSHAYSSTGVYTVKLKACKNDICDSLMKINYVTVNEADSVPIITLNNNQLSTSVIAAHYQWYRNNNLIVGATLSTYTLTQDGDYMLKITNVNGCVSSSAIYSYYPVHINFSADTLVYCNTTSAEVLFNNTTLNATSYLWDFGDGTTSTLSNPSHTYINAGTYSVKLKACSTLGCDSLVLNNYIKINSTSIIASITPIDTTVICSGSQLMIHGTAANGNTYQWRLNNANIIGANDTSYLVTSSGIYDLVVTNTLGCINTSNKVTVTVDSVCVWPGDADHSYTVDNYDLLSIGLFYSNTGPARGSISNNWQGYSAINWNSTQANGSNLKHVDCNGDGIINDSDTLAINLNYTFMHTERTHESGSINNGRTVNANLYFHTSALTFQPGNWVDVDIMLGDSVTSLNNIYGIAFDFSMENSLIEPGTASILYSNSWLGVIGLDAIKFEKIDGVNNMAHCAITRTNHINSNGFGKIATLRFKINSAITTLENMNLSFVGYKAVDATGYDITLNPEPIIIEIDPLATLINNLQVNTNNLNISPNPFLGSTQISYILAKQSIISLEVYNSIGQKLETLVAEKQSGGQYNYTFNTKEKGYNSGIYILKMSLDGNVVNRKIIELK